LPATASSCNCSPRSLQPICEPVPGLGEEIARHDPQAWVARLPVAQRRRLTDCEV